MTSLRCLLQEALCHKQVISSSFRSAEFFFNSSLEADCMKLFVHDFGEINFSDSSKLIVVIPDRSLVVSCNVSWQQHVTYMPARHVCYMPCLTSLCLTATAKWDFHNSLIILALKAALHIRTECVEELYSVSAYLITIEGRISSMSWSFIACENEIRVAHLKNTIYGSRYRLSNGPFFFLKSA